MATFYTQEDLPLATEDVVVEQELEHGVKVERKVFAGTRVPAELVDQWREQTGAGLSEGEQRALDAEKERAEAMAAVEKAKAEAQPGETPESEKGDPAPARQARRR